MCGIFGVTCFEESGLGRAREALHTLAHRGPDQWGDYFDDKIYMGHRRLSILDLSESGKQPMISSGGDVVITVNGEIYNYREIKKELTAKASFFSRSDSEVILHGYRAWGIEKLLEKMDGMYAFSIYDKKAGKLFLARDRMGIKPLYYANKGGKQAYASELKAIQKFFGAGDLKIDETALYDFLTYRYIPAPKTMYKEVYKLEPGHYLTMDLNSGRVTDTQYWKLEVNPCDDSIGTAKEKITGLIKKSIDEQMMSDVPVGFFLSGGLDSSAVVAAASKGEREISTFSIGFSDKNHDETHFADLIAEKYGTRHYKKILDADQTKEMFSRIREWYDEPFADTSCFPTFLVSKYARENVTVALTGDGGDEIFGGYNWYRQFREKSRFRVPSLAFLRKGLSPFRGENSLSGKIVRRIENPYLLSDLELYTKLKSGLIRESKKTYKERWGIPEEYDDYWFSRKYYRNDLDMMTRLQYLDFNTYLPDDILTKVDRVSMAVSLECRVPLLSKELVEYLFSLPAGVRLFQNELKGAMKEAFRDELPPEILNRDKKGFSIPFQAWKNSVFAGENNRQEYILKHVFGDISGENDD